ncbi:MFS transporter [Paraburkholderia caribensis]|uniref:MFS transporter n=1 Tax=Paraburkholderia caribensis TaxID=75105 RepID=UPI001CC5835B|nr:MFS transporter [Paraburkholderia caribensis]
MSQQISSPLETTSLSSEIIAARIERIPISSWHSKARSLLGIATFFDAFDTLAIAQVLPVLATSWSLTPLQIGLLISTGYLGQLLGALGFGWLAGRIGRVKSLLIAITIFTLMSVLCGMSHNYTALVWSRFFQGVGLGGEVPVAAVYMSEVTAAKRRGRFLLLYELLFSIGLLFSGLIGIVVVPNLGWQWMFFAGAAPAILLPILPVFFPESPRWLASCDRVEEAAKALTRIEDAVERATKNPLPAFEIAPSPEKIVRPSWRDYFAPPYGTRTLVLWSMWFGAYLVYYGLGTWMPTLYTTMFHLPVQQALHYALFTNGSAIVSSLFCILAIDSLGRRRTFLISFIGCALTFTYLYFSNLQHPGPLAAAAGLCCFFASMTTFSVYVYTPECYPTRARGQGVGMAAAWSRIASIIGPSFIGLVVKTGLGNIFLAFGVVAAIVAVLIYVLAPETSGKSLEELSP